MTSASAYFVPGDVRREGFEAFDATHHTVSLWAPDMQHGAPPSALLVRALERCRPRAGTRLSRVAIDILGPVPVAAIDVRAWVERPGTRVELVVAELWAEHGGSPSRPVARASAWRMSTTDTTAVQHVADPVLEPRSAATEFEIGAEWDSGYIDSLELCWLPGSRTGGPGRLWARPRIDLISGEEMSPLQRLFSIADIANGVGAQVPISDWTFLNTDLTVHIFREPIGEWVGISAETSTGPDGIAMCAGVVHDDNGPVGRINQAVLVRPR